MSKSPLKIAHWDDIYETYETRKLACLRWVAIPNKHDGLGFRRLAAHRDRCDLLAAWILIVQIASKGRVGQRGRLERDGKALTPEDLSLMTGFPAQIFETALEFFASDSQAWLVAGDNGDIPSSPASDDGQPIGSPGSPAVPPGSPARRPAHPAEPPAVWNGLEGMEHKAAGGGGDRKRNPLFDALATVEGSTGKITKSGGGSIAKALSEIKEITPDLTPEEIFRRAANYRRLMPGATLTATALAKHWARCATGPGANEQIRLGENIR